MRVLFIRELNPFFDSTASGNRYAGLLLGLSHLGVNIDLLITGGYHTINEYRSRKIPISTNISVKYIIPYFNNNIWLIRIKTYLFDNLFSFIINSSFQKSLTTCRYDIVWLAFNTTVLKAYLKRKKDLNALFFIDLTEYNDLHEGHIKLGNEFQLSAAKKENKVFLNAVHSIDLFGIVSKTLITHYKAMMSKQAKILHLPMTVDFSRFIVFEKHNPNFQKPYIAYIGTFNNQKDGVDILIKAFSKIAHKFKDYKLYLAGFYHYDVDVNNKLINDNHLEDRIIIVGVLDKQQIPSFLNQASLLVMARPDSRQARGGFPTKLGEYLATGNPVCVTKVGEIPYYLKDSESAFFANPGDVDSFADAMDRALTFPVRAKTIGMNGLKVAKKNFDANLQAKRLFDFFTENLSKN